MAAHTAFGLMQQIRPEDNGAKWEGLVMRALSRALDVTLRAAGAVATATWSDVFVLSYRPTTCPEHDGGVFVERMEDLYGLRTSSFDALMEEERPRILIVNYLDKGQVRVTATVPISF